MGSISGGRIHPTVSSHSFTLRDMVVFKQVTAAGGGSYYAGKGAFSSLVQCSRCYISRSYKEGGDSVQMRALTSRR